MLTSSAVLGQTFNQFIYRYSLLYLLQFSYIKYCFCLGKIWFVLLRRIRETGWNYKVNKGFDEITFNTLITFFLEKVQVLDISNFVVLDISIFVVLDISIFVVLDMSIFVVLDMSICIYTRDYFYKKLKYLVNAAHGVALKKVPFGK